ncbi:MAG: DUF1971 domain-containing protein [Parasphingorhabdus sp.]
MSKPEAYKSTPVFDETTLPQALQEAHNTKAGTWGLLELISGELIYVIEESGNRRQMTAGDTQIIEPQQLHHVELVGPMQMQVHFFREIPD